MNLAEPFVRRPVATTLLSIGLMLVGLVAYRNLPVASLPTVDLPTLRVSASRPGADPETMATSVSAPLERRLGAIAGVTEITSVSSLGSATIAIQFDLSRRIDKAAQDVQSAINASAADLPSDMPTLPTVRKSNPAASPILVISFHVGYIRLDDGLVLQNQCALRVDLLRCGDAGSVRPPGTQTLQMPFGSCDFGIAQLGLFIIQPSSFLRVA